MNSDFWKAGARAEIRRLNRLHGPVSGSVRDPGAARLAAVYDARDPWLSLWVHATLVDSTLATVDAWLEPLSRERRARFYTETVPVGRLFGVPAAMLPADVEAFDAWMADQWAPDGPVHPTAVARDLAWTILHPPLGPLAASGPVATRLGAAAGPAATLLDQLPDGMVRWVLVPSLGLLPEPVRREYGLPWGSRERLLSAWLVAAWRTWRPLLPPTWRWFPQALAADARMAGASRAAG